MTVFYVASKQVLFILLMIFVINILGILFSLYFQNACFYVGICVFYLIASSLLIHLVYEYYQKYTWIPHRTTNQLLITGVSCII